MSMNTGIELGKERYSSLHTYFTYNNIYHTLTLKKGKPTNLKADPA